MGIASCRMRQVILHLEDKNHRTKQIAILSHLSEKRYLANSEPKRHDFLHMHCCGLKNPHPEPKVQIKQHTVPSLSSWKLKSRVYIERACELECRDGQAISIQINQFMFQTFTVHDVIWHFLYRARNANGYLGCFG